MSTAALLTRLLDLKRTHGVDFLFHTSWCSDSANVVVIVRRKGQKFGKPLFGPVEEVLKRAVAEALLENGVRRMRVVEDDA